MTILIRNAQGEIKTYTETAAGLVLESGEAMEEVDLPLGVYAHRLRLLVGGRSGELIQAATDSGAIAVQVECPGEATVALDINGLVESIPLVDGKGAVTLGTDVPGTFIITPADRMKYCAAGEAVCIVEVKE
jgi:hypothetical protein